MLAQALAGIGGLMILVVIYHAYSAGVGKKPSVLAAASSRSSLTVPSFVALWLLKATLWHARAELRWTAPLLFAVGAIVLFAIGLLSALVLAVFGNDRDLRGTAFGVAHAHYLLWGTALLALLGGLVYWWPKIFGRLLGTAHRRAAPQCCSSSASTCTFFVQFLLGDQGQAAGAPAFSAHGSTAAYNMISTIGAFTTAVGALLFLLAVARARQRHAGRQRPLARRHARVVHDLAAAGAQLRLGAAGDERAAAARPPRDAEGAQCALTDGLADPRLPGRFSAWRSRAEPSRRPSSSRAPHSISAAGTGPRRSSRCRCSSAAVVIARLAYPRLLAATSAALGLLLVAIATGGLVALTDDARWAVALHVAAAGASLAASLVALVVSFRGAPVAVGPWRDYVTLTKPRIMSLLLLTGAAGMFVGAQGWPTGWLFVAMMVGLALACGGSSALNHVMDADIDRLMGERTAARPVASGPRRRPARARVRRRPDGALVRAARDDRERPDRGAGARRRPLLRRRLHRLPEALDRPEHRHRRRRGRRAAARRLRRGDRATSPCRRSGCS